MENQERALDEERVASYPVVVQIPYSEKSSRGLALATVLFIFPKLVIILPHIIILYFLRIGAFFAWIAGQFAVLFTGRYPKKLHSFVSGVLRWQARVAAYFTGLSDDYPPFSLR